METLRSPSCVHGTAGGGSQLARRNSVLRESTVRECVSPASPRPVQSLAGAAPLTQPRLRPQIRRDDPLNLSILLSGGKETNKDSPSSGERRGKSPAPNPRPPRARDMWRIGDGCRPGVDRGPESF